MLSKSKGQILRVAAVLHVLFHIDTPMAIPGVIGTDAVKASIDLVDMSIQHAAYLAGRGKLEQKIEELAQGANIVVHFVIALFTVFISVLPTH